MQLLLRTHTLLDSNLFKRVLLCIFQHFTMLWIIYISHLLYALLNCHICRNLEWSLCQWNGNTFLTISIFQTNKRRLILLDKNEQREWSWRRNAVECNILELHWSNHHAAHCKYSLKQSTWQYGIVTHCWESTQAAKSELTSAAGNSQRLSYLFPSGEGLLRWDKLSIVKLKYLREGYTDGMHFKQWSIKKKELCESKHFLGE